jgi:hypothetical protein
MTLEALLACVERLDIVLTVEGDRLLVDAPPGALTNALQTELAIHKPALLALLAPVTEYVMLKGGLAVPVSPLQLAWSLENRGFRMSVDACHQFVIEPVAELTDADRAGIHRWRLHLSAIVEYQCPESELP